MPTVLITGGHGGIGLECSKHLASHYRTNLLLAGRNLERVKPVARELAKTYGVKVNTLELDTSSMESVHGCGKMPCHAGRRDGRSPAGHSLQCWRAH